MSLFFICLWPPSRPGSSRHHTSRTFISFELVLGPSMARNLYFLGTAGSGKSTMVYAFQLWMNSQGLDCVDHRRLPGSGRDRKSTRLNSSHSQISYAVFCLKKKK